MHNWQRKNTKILHDKLVNLIKNVCILFKYMHSNMLSYAVISKSVNVLHVVGIPLKHTML